MIVATPNAQNTAQYTTPIYAVMWYAACLLASQFELSSTKNIARSLFAGKIGISTYEEGIAFLLDDIEASCITYCSDDEAEWSDESARDAYLLALDFWKE